MIDVLSNGYKLPFKTIPPSARLKNNRSAFDNPEIVTREIEKLVEKGCVREVDHCPTVVNPLTVAFNKSNKPRLVLDCRHINVHLFKFKVRFEDQSIAGELFSKGCFLFSFDLKSAYHHIEISEPHRTFLGFSWLKNGLEIFYVFNVLPFGISVAGCIFTKVLRFVVKRWRSMGHKVVMFLDDGLGGSDTYSAAYTLAHFVKSDLENFGFLLAHDKCIWLPVQSIVWLGYLWDTLNGTISVTEERLSNFECSISKIIDQVLKGNCLLFAKTLAKVIGQLMSMKCSVGLVVQLRTRSMYKCLNQRASWSSPVRVSAEALDEMLFWKEHVRSLNKAELGQAWNAPDSNIYSDASDLGYCGYITSDLENPVIGTWSTEEGKSSSTWRELEAVHRVMQSYGDSLEGHHVCVNTDNTSACSILGKGSKKPHLQEIAMKIDNLCRTKGIKVDCCWIPRTVNVQADFLSRCHDSDDWSVLDWLFRFLDKKWGPYTVDRFASDYNAKCEIFNSRFWCPHTSGVDAFKQIWSNQANWVVPPPRLVCRSINKVLTDKCSCTLVIPEWRSAPFWPILFPDGKSIAKFVTDTHYFKPGILTRRGRGKNGIFDGRPLKIGLLALKIDSSC